MSDNIVEHPNTTLKRRIEQLETRVKILERDQEHRLQMDLIMLRNYEEMKDLVRRAMKLLDQYPPKV